MKKYILITAIALFSFCQLFAQKPEKIYSIAKVQKPHSFFVKQAVLWYKEIEKDKKNENAWYNYYKANRYAKMTFEKNKDSESGKIDVWTDESKYLKEAEEISELITEAIPKTFTYYIVTKEGYPDDKKRLEALQKAFELDTENPDTYDEFVVYYETNIIAEKRKEFNEKWYQSNDLSSGILNYNYNVLVSMSDGAAILTFGDNDSFPIWMIQDVLGVREDVTVLNVHLMTMLEYRKALFNKLNIPEIEGSGVFSTEQIIDHIIKNRPDNLPLYISNMAWKQFTEYDENLYMVGLVMQYSEENLDNIALLKNNFENKFALDYLQNQFNFDVSYGIVNRINVNYMPGIIKLFKHYKLCGDIEKARKMKELGLLIAEKGGQDWEKMALEIFE